MCISTHTYIHRFPKQCLSFIVVPLNSRIASGQPRCLSLISPAADSLYSRIAGGQPRYLPKPSCQ